MLSWLGRIRVRKTSKSCQIYNHHSLISRKSLRCSHFADHNSFYPWSGVFLPALTWLTSCSLDSWQHADKVALSCSRTWCRTLSPSLSSVRLSCVLFFPLFLMLSLSLSLVSLSHSLSVCVCLFPVSGYANCHHHNYLVMAPKQPPFLSLFILAGERLVLILPYKHLNVKAIDVKSFQSPSVRVVPGNGSYLDMV